MYQITQNTKKRRLGTASAVKAAWSEGKALYKRRILVKFPDVNDHKMHLTNEVCIICMFSQLCLEINHFESTRQCLVNE